MAPGSPCPSENTLVAFVAGKLPAEALAEVQSHLDACALCVQLLPALGSIGELALPPAGRPIEQIDEYRLLEPLGQGAMGQVYLGHDTLLDRPVAIKFVAALQPDAATRQRFLVEARAIARLTHPNVVAIHRVGEVARRSSASRRTAWGCWGGPSTSG